MERIKLLNVSKKFIINPKSNQSFLEFILNIFSIKNKKISIRALDNVSFSIYSGEIVGIIGENGSGKSTLLRIISDIYKPDSGKIYLNGEPIPVINLYAGLQDRLSVKENIFLLSSFFGAAKKEIKIKLDSIVKFAELENFINTRVYQLSDGMKLKLVFSISIHSEPKILLLDEIIEIGDAHFRIKHINKVKELVKKGSSVVLVSHDINIIRKYCDRVIWIKSGKVYMQGNPNKVVKKYINYSLT